MALMGAIPSRWYLSNLSNYVSNPKNQAANQFLTMVKQVPTTFPFEPGAVPGLCSMCSQVLEVQGQAGLWVLLSELWIAVEQGLDGSQSCPPPPHPPFPWSLKLHLVNSLLFEARTSFLFSLCNDCKSISTPGLHRAQLGKKKKANPPPWASVLPPPAAPSLPGR